jgi:hypothetical protein
MKLHFALLHQRLSLIRTSCISKTIANGHLQYRNGLHWLESALEEHSNTKYFQSLANGRHMKTRIFQLRDGGLIFVEI